MNAKKHICPETIKISYNLKGLWNETSFSFAQHLSTPAGSLTLLEKPKLGRCCFNWHWLLLQAPKSAGLPQLTCSTPRQPLQRLRDELRARLGVQHVAGTAVGVADNTSRHIQLGWNPPGPTNTTSAELQSALQPPAGSPAPPYPFLILWAFRPVVSDSKLATRKLKKILSICSAEQLLENLRPDEAVSENLNITTIKILFSWRLFILLNHRII